jgi:hypothetical protein
VLRVLFFFTGLFVLLLCATSAAGCAEPVFLILALFLLFLVCNLRAVSR